MHMYLRSAGFSGYSRKEEIRELLDRLMRDNIDETVFVTDANNDIHWELRAETAENMGICMAGSMDGSGEMIRERYYPYMLTEEKSSLVSCSIQRHIDDEIYSGLLDDNRVGISLIFRIDNNAEYMERKEKGLPLRVHSTSLYSWCRSGKILLPVLKTAKQVQLSRNISIKRDSLIEAAKNGDESAMESLSFDDMNMYASISRRMMNEDIYSIVDNCFMPQGIECDIYSIIGDIKEVNISRNRISEEEIYDLTVECNDIPFHVGINKQDLDGEPEVGRRFKGRIWMLGNISFE